MLEKLRQFITDVVSPDANADQKFDDTGFRLAATALHSMIETRFELDPGTADRLIEAATLVEGEAVDLYHFTSVIMRVVDEPGRIRLVEMMWELVFADGKVSEFEENVVWRAADLLGVSARDRVELKRRVAGDTAESGAIA
jgi:uncharacterized tellurite resistance protein B-like protein